MVARALLWALAALLVTGCSGDVPQREAAAAAVAFVTGDPPQACDRRAPDTRDALERRATSPCETALPALGLPSGSQVQRSEVAGEAAQVSFADQVVLLGPFRRRVAGDCGRLSAHRHPCLSTL